MAGSHSPNNQVDSCPDNVGFSLFFSFFPWYLPYDKDIGNNSYLPVFYWACKRLSKNFAMTDFIKGNPYEMNCAYYLSFPQAPVACRGLANMMRGQRKAVQVLISLYFLFHHYHFFFFPGVVDLWGQAGQEETRMAAEGRLYGQGVKGWPCMSLCLSIQKNIGETKTVSRSDQRVLPVQQVCTEGEKTEETIFNSAFLYSITGWKHNVTLTPS